MKKYVILCAILLTTAVFVIPASAAITAHFEFSVDSSNPMTIHFTDKSTGNPGNWFWTFNDGGAISNERNPTHTFSGEGDFRVALVASDANYGNENTAMKFIKVTRSGVTEDNSGSSSSSGSSSGGSSGGFSMPALSFGGITIPNPLDLIDEYIKLIRVMIIPANYKI
ncbi:PKD domain-containing protein [Methanorbis furvi]|uniref:PKD domain-containing protein n=1 Tax=Methanorbis furvi TaxID=3028299 RepID=A0AAE4SB52_9EURY|nr:hypothetical protein [Methanocorpusculaceae archaeon Ag1]